MVSAWVEEPGKDGSRSLVGETGRSFLKEASGWQRADNVGSIGACGGCRKLTKESRSLRV